MKTAWDHLDDFVDLPTDVKEHYIRGNDDNHGYINPGIERFNNGSTPELRHAFNICTLNAKSLPEEPLPGFADHITTLAQDLKSLSHFLLQALAISLDIPQTFFLEKHSHMLSGDHDNETTLRLLYYPPIIEDTHNHDEYFKGRCQYTYQRCCARNPPDFRPEPDKYDEEDDDEDDELTDNQIGGINNTRNRRRRRLNSNEVTTERRFPNGEIIRCGAHTDYGTFTLLAQDSEGGLEVKLPGKEKWQRVGHLPGALLINCGEILSIWTQNHYPALVKYNINYK